MFAILLHPMVMVVCCMSFLDCQPYRYGPVNWLFRLVRTVPCYFICCKVVLPLGDQ